MWGRSIWLRASNDQSITTYHGNQPVTYTSAGITLVNNVTVYQ